MSTVQVEEIKSLNGGINLNETDPMTELGKLIDSLEKQIRGQSTIKREIKEGVKKLQSFFGSFKRHYAQIKAIAAENNEQNAGIRSELKVEMNEEEINNLITKNWPSTAFKNTMDTNGKRPPISKCIESTIVFPEQLEKDQNFIKVSQKWPQLKELTPSILKMERTIVIEDHTITQISGLSTGEDDKRSVHIVQGAILSEAGSLETADIMNWVDRLKEEAEKRRLDAAILNIPARTDAFRLRKTLECCLYGSNLLVYLGGQPIRREEKEQLIVHVGQSSFSDVVKKLKDEINPNDIGVKIQSMSKTTKGDLKITYIGKEPKDNSLMKSIAKSVDTKVTSLYQTKGIVVFDIEDDIEEGEIMETLAVNLDISKETIHLNPLRKMLRGTKMVTAYLPVRAALEAIRLKRIKLGWTYCRIKEKIDPDFCTKCQTFGHLHDQCKEKSLSDRKCMRCGEVSHATRECKNEEKCFTCKKSGHRANSARCPTYKQLLQDKRVSNRK